MSHHFNATLNIPPRGPGEEPLTKKQFDYIVALTTEIDREQIRGLGKWQASSLIDQIRKAKDDAGMDFAQKAAAKEKSNEVLWYAIMIAVLTVLVFAFAFSTLR